MKKLFLVLSLVGICSLGYAQDVKVNINNQDASVKDDCPYRINGICASEDIGGVEVEEGYGGLVFKNYNSFPVTVLWHVKYLKANGARCDYDEKKGSLVLGVEGQREVALSCCSSGCFWSLMGLIVRKLAQ